MGVDKGLLEFNGKPMIHYVIDCVKPLFGEVNIISNNPSYRQFGFSVIEDHIKGIGPVGGILTGLRVSPTDWNFFIACDLPFMNSSLISSLLRDVNYDQAIVPVHNTQVEPLSAFYNRNGIPVIEEQIKNENYKMRDLIYKLQTKFVTVPENTSLELIQFKNMNTIEDIRKFKVL